MKLKTTRKIRYIKNITKSYKGRSTTTNLELISHYPYPNLFQIKVLFKSQYHYQIKKRNKKIKMIKKKKRLIAKNSLNIISKM